MSNPIHVSETGRVRGLISGESPGFIQVQATRERGSRTQFRDRDRVAALRTMNAAGSMVYAIRTPDGLIKIGLSTDLATRRRHIGDEMLAVMFGDHVAEQAIHDQLSGHAHHGREWYYPTPEVLAVVNDMRARVGLEPLVDQPAYFRSSLTTRVA